MWLGVVQWKMLKKHKIDGHFVQKLFTACILYFFCWYSMLVVGYSGIFEISYLHACWEGFLGIFVQILMSGSWVYG